MNIMIQTIKKYGDPAKIGNFAMRARIRIYLSMTVPTLYHNLETWSIMPKTILNKLESIQYEIIRSICEQKKSTPYWGLLAETGIWPVEHHIDFKRILLFKRILGSNDDRL